MNKFNGLEDEFWSDPAIKKTRSHEPQPPLGSENDGARQALSQLKEDGELFTSELGNYDLAVLAGQTAEWGVCNPSADGHDPLLANFITDDPKGVCVGKIYPLVVSWHVALAAMAHGQMSSGAPRSACRFVLVDMSVMAHAEARLPETDELFKAHEIIESSADMVISKTGFVHRLPGGKGQSPIGRVRCNGCELLLVAIGEPARGVCRRFDEAPSGDDTFSKALPRELRERPAFEAAKASVTTQITAVRELKRTVLERPGGGCCILSEDISTSDLLDNGLAILMFKEGTLVKSAHPLGADAVVCLDETHAWWGDGGFPASVRAFVGPRWLMWGNSDEPECSACLIDALWRAMPPAHRASPPLKFELHDHSVDDKLKHSHLSSRVGTMRGVRTLWTKEHRPLKARVSDLKAMWMARGPAVASAGYNPSAAMFEHRFGEVTRAEILLLRREDAGLFTGFLQSRKAALKLTGVMP